YTTLSRSVQRLYRGHSSAHREGPQLPMGPESLELPVSAQADAPPFARDTGRPVRDRGKVEILLGIPGPAPAQGVEHVMRHEAPKPLVVMGIGVLVPVELRRGAAVGDDQGRRVRRPRFPL